MSDKDKFKVNLLYKGAKPAKKQRRPRSLKVQGLERFTTEFYNNNKEEVESVLSLYANSNEKVQESILTVLICQKNCL